MNPVKHIVFVSIGILLGAGCSRSNGNAVSPDNLVGKSAVANVELALKMKRKLDQNDVNSVRQMVTGQILVESASVYKLAKQNRIVLDEDELKLLADVRTLFSDPNQLGSVSNSLPSVRNDIEAFLKSR